MSIGRKIALGFALALAFLAGLAAVSYWSIDRLGKGMATLTETNHLVNHTLDVLGGLERLLSLLKDAETGQRGYLLTGEDKYLEPYNESVDQIHPALDKVQQLTADNDDQQERLRALKVPLEAKLAELQETIVERKKGDQGEQAALKLVKSDKGKLYMDQCRKIVLDMENAERTLLHQRNDAAEKSTAQVAGSAQLTRYLILLGGPLALLTLGVVSYFIARSITLPVRQAVSQLTSAGSELAASTTQQAAGAQEQAAAVSETVATVDEVTQTSEQSSQRAKGVGEAVQRALDVGKEGRRVVGESQAALEALRERVESTAETILALAGQAQAIGEIIATVTDVAEQTNLLALNAAIEASRAGEHGRGFAVVAGEVKALADQSKKATAQVRQILTEIQKATNAAVLSTEDVTKGVAAATKVAGQAGDTIAALAETLQETARAAAQIVASAGQQAAGMAQIHQAMKNIDQVARQNLAAMRQAEQAAQNLNALGNQLGEMLGK